MQLLAISIFICMVLYLVDKNEVWRPFWRCLKVGAIIGIVALAVMLGYGQYEEHQAAKAKQIDFTQHVTITPDPQ